MHPLWPSVAASAVGPRSPGPGPLRWTDLVTEWRIDPVALALLLAVGATYTWYRLRASRSGLAWARRRDVTFGLGMLAAVWVCCGVAQARATQVEWVWIAQLLALLLVVPVVVLAGQPVQLARTVSHDTGLVARLVRARLVRIISNPLIGPALIPLVFLILLFGGVGQASVASAPTGWIVHLALLLLGAAIALPLVDSSSVRTSLGVGIALAVGFVELILDVFPGIVLRLVGHPVIAYFAVHTPAWEGGWLHAQHDAGGLLWMAAEILDLPFVVLLMVRWSRVDAAEAAEIDARLDAEEMEGESTRLWFLDDPQLRDRYQH